ncbi:MAG TPA: 6-carboxytetrahydropterin synthase [Rhodopila sp.]|uniref:6-pyruvoyl trahydropterin synthase family protein n=1 Tax=Rhodopila sp. TaxID=2480087 RepID=UPI002C8CFDF2|nr:6-carboxytetrahydropterin synthase [Rhodopila sp.]HVY14223.1 6-carboxytetrahydropterin synthase [Rhodopila sp.]
MFSLTISDHIMIAHSIRGAEFEPAQGLHGNTLVVEVEFRAPALDRLNFLVDVDLAKAELRKVLDVFDYKNLDEVTSLAGQNTTMEFLSRHLHGLLAAACRDGRLGEAARSLTAMKVLLRESPRAWASFEGPIAG